MKLLILGNHTCGNRGDSAILRGLLDAINTLKPETEVDVMSRYPVSSSWLLNRPVMGDPLYSQMKQHNNAAGVMGRVKKVLRRRYQHQVLLSRVTDTGKLRNIAIAQGFTDFVRLLAGYDAIIQVGGSFFVDLYGVPQFEHALCTFMAKKPLFMIGHSVGPFQDPQFNQLANYVFGHCDALILRESVSLDMMKRSEIDTTKVEHGVDTAWLVDHQDDSFQASYAVQHWLDVAAKQKTVAITLRELAPFDKRLGTTQAAYEIMPSLVGSEMCIRDSCAPASCRCNPSDCGWPSLQYRRPRPGGRWQSKSLRFRTGRCPARLRPRPAALSPAPA